MLKKPVFLVVSAVLAAPSGAENGMAFAGPAILVTLLAGAYTVKRGLSWIAWCLLAFLRAQLLVWLSSCLVSEVWSIPDRG